MFEILWIIFIFQMLNSLHYLQFIVLPFPSLKSKHLYVILFIMFIAKLWVLMLVVLAKSDSYCGSYNCYELLGVSQRDDEATIRKAYREMAKKYHPDKNRDDTTEYFQ